MARTFVPSRPAAQHCAELIRRGPRPEEREAQLAAWRRNLGQQLAIELAEHVAGDKLQVTISEPETIDGSAVFERIGPVAANSLLRCGEGDHTLLFSLDFATAIALTDCMFGGDGALPETAPARLPRSAMLAVERLAEGVARVIAFAKDPGECAREHGVVLVRSESVTRLKPFAHEDKVACFKLILAMGATREWTILLAISNDRLDTILPGPAARPRARASNDPARGPFAELPLPLCAVLSNIELSLAALQALRPGDTIPLAVARTVPLCTGDTIFAHGTVGSFEDRLALRLSNPNCPTEPSR
ncbi:MAG: FliM/FliN family flagellar motor C-terminal domain-containing protein [Erythrobacter sp.]|jgi:flagellar motor switch/type III secretory pathway protein FliN|nr:FliM/FliN family flagellar motor C-terminal domain-containing protein [Erythrobacter sp.]